MKGGPPLRAAVLGASVARSSRSPAIHEAAYEALGLRGEYRAIDVTSRGFDALVRRLAREGLRYVNVTIPHKRAAAKLADSRSLAVRWTGAANTLIFFRARRARSLRARGSRARVSTVHIRAENTDGLGLLDALAGVGMSVSGEKVVLVGSGGAAAGALLALARSGARVIVVARRPAAARRLFARLPRRLRAQVTSLPWSAEALASVTRGSSLVVSAVPAEAWTPAHARVAMASLPRNGVVLEMAYGQGTTTLDRAARRQGVRYVDGIPMLVHQAARALRQVLRKGVPIGPLSRAARATTSDERHQTVTS